MDLSSWGHKELYTTEWLSLFTFKLDFNSTWTKNFQMYKTDLEKGEELIANIHWLIEKARGFQKNSYLFHWLG